MKKTALNKNISREIIKTKSRFLSIAGMIAIGVMVFIGLKVAGPSMTKYGDEYIKEVNLSEFTLMSNYGLDDKDIEILKNNKDIKEIEMGYFLDLITTDKKNILRVLSESENLNKTVVTNGRLPEKENEILLDDSLETVKYKIGDIIYFDKENSENLKNPEEDKYFLKNYEFKIVGFGNNPKFIGSGYKGITNIGIGDLAGFAIIKKDVFEMDNYVFTSFNYKDINSLKYNSKEERDQIRALKKEIKSYFSERETEKYDEMKKYVEYVTQKPAENIEKPIYMINSRLDHMMLYNFFDNAKRLNIISNIFPVLFFLIAILVSYTTITRMVDEQHIEIGTLKSLGYSNYDIMKKYFIYGSIASIIGSIVGLFIGYLLITPSIISAYLAETVFKSIEVQFSVQYTSIGILIGLFCVIFASFKVILTTVNENTITILRGKPPRSGTRVFVERITPLWNRLSFLYKVTLRNLFRYKRRMIMTILGVAGCTGLMFMGFGIKDSITGIIDKQFVEIIKYNYTVNLKNNKTKEDFKDYENLIKDSDLIKNRLYVTENSVTINDHNDIEHKVSIIIPENINKIEGFINLRDRLSKKEISLEVDGMVINEKLSKLINKKVGDTVIFQDEDFKEYEGKISAISENYVGHYIYMAPKYYEKIYGEKPEINQEFLEIKDIKIEDIKDEDIKDEDIKIKDIKIEDTKTENKNTENTEIKDTEIKNREIEKLVSEIIENKAVSSVLKMNLYVEQMEDITSSLNLIISIIVICSCALAIIVLYNLNNINILERVRELSTIKVLGFYSKEVTAYVYRETIFLTIIGIFLGYGVGYFMHDMIISKLIPNYVMLDPSIRLSNYIKSGSLTLLFLLIVLVIVHKKIDKIDMVEALKSME